VIQPGLPGGGLGQNGSPGLFRLFTEDLAGQISWLLPFAFIALFALWRRPRSVSAQGLEETGIFGDRGLTLVALNLWLVPGLLYFSFTTGFWHPYYLATIAPPLAALVGIGAAALYEAYFNQGWRGWLLAAAVPITALVQVIILLYDAEWSAGLIVLVSFAAALVTLVLVTIKLKNMTHLGLLPKAVAFVAIAILFIAPFVWACTPLMYGTGNPLPAAGPQLAQGGLGPGGGPGNSGSESGISQLAGFLSSHTTNETWKLAVPSGQEASGLIANEGIPVMSLGGFSGDDQILSVSAVKNLIRNGTVRYFLTPSTGQNDGPQSGNAQIFTWVSSHCTIVPASEYGGNTGTGTGMPGPESQSALYDCAGSD
jgi:4-amino-4-deoxy-L-arabinose transferase-like glycosyltransferase